MTNSIGSKTAMSSVSGSGNHKPPPLPPKVPFHSHNNHNSHDTKTTSSLEDYLNKPPRVASRGCSMSSIASDSSRDSLRREVNRRRQSITPSEYNFIQNIVTSGTEVEVLLVQQKLCDPSLGFDVNAEEAAAEEEQSIGNDTAGTNSVVGPPSLPRVVVHHDAGADHSDTPSHALEDTDTDSLTTKEEGDVMDWSADASLATGQGKPPTTPLPRSPLRDQRSLDVPSHEELYPEMAAASESSPVLTTPISSNNGGFHHHDPIHLHHSHDAAATMMPNLYDSSLDQTPLVQNITKKPHKSLEGAAALPLPTSGSTVASIMRPNLHLPGPPPPNNQAIFLPKPTSSTTSSSPQNNSKPQLIRRASNPLVDQLWRAHEKGLAVTPQQSSKRIILRREQSLSGISPLRRASGGAGRRLSSADLATILRNHNRQQNQHARSMTDLFPSQPQKGWQNLVLQNTSTDDSTGTDDITSLLLPTDEEIFRRSLQQKQQNTTTSTSSSNSKDTSTTAATNPFERPPPPRPFRESPTPITSAVAAPPIPQGSFSCSPYGDDIEKNAFRWSSCSAPASLTTKTKCLETNDVRWRTTQEC
jgi:hypothetical protein